MLDSCWVVDTSCQALLQVAGALCAGSCCNNCLDEGVHRHEETIVSVPLFVLTTTVTLPHSLIKASRFAECLFSKCQANQGYTIFKQQPTHAQVCMHVGALHAHCYIGYLGCQDNAHWKL